MSNNQLRTCFKAMHTPGIVSGTFLHSHSHTPSIAFRHLPPQSLTHSEHRFPALSSTVTHTLRASLSGTFHHSHSHTPSIAFRHLPPQSFTLRASLSGTFHHSHSHTPSIAFRHFAPNSARIGYATEGALFISARLSTDAVSTFRKVWVAVRLWKQHSALART